METLEDTRIVIKLISGSMINKNTLQYLVNERYGKYIDYIEITFSLIMIVNRGMFTHLENRQTLSQRKLLMVYEI